MPNNQRNHRQTRISVAWAPLYLNKYQLRFSLNQFAVLQYLQPKRFLLSHLPQTS